MRKLWPPTYDDFSIRFWAATVAVSTQILAVLLGCFHAALELMLVLIWPRLIPFLLVTGQNIEEIHFSWLGIIVGLTVNLAFYYFVTWFAILLIRRAIQPTKEWWPGEPS